MEQEEHIHKRRVRYSGTHPKRFEEKYKELNPEKYADTVAKVIAKGSTPAGMHIPIMVEEILDFLQIKPGQKGLDATLGYGGHTKEMLQRLNGQGHLYALDADPIESVKTTAQLKQVIETALAFLPEEGKKEAVKKSCQRTFQALRIDVNNEYEVLEAFMSKLPDVLAPGGRAAVLTFHSGEDRIVKKAFKQFYREGVYEEIAKDVIRPSAQECMRNSRAHSTKMRWAVKAGR